MIVGIFNYAAGTVKCANPRGAVIVVTSFCLFVYLSTCFSSSGSPQTAPN